MPVLSKPQALAYIDAKALSIDASPATANPFATAMWLRLFIEQVGDDNWHFLLLECGEGGTGLMPLYRDAGAPLHARSLSNFYTSLFEPILGSKGMLNVTAQQLVQELCSLRPTLATVTLEPLDADADETAQLTEALRSSGWFVRRYFRFGNLSLASDGLSFQDYMAARDSQLRNTYQRKAKKLLSVGSLEIVTAPADVGAAMDAYEEIHARSWKRPEPYPHFARSWALLCAQKGWLRLGVARVEGVAVAAQIWFVFNRKAFIFKLVYDEAQAKWSAGTVLTAHLMRHVLDIDKVVEVDFLSGDDPYKSTWMSRRRDRVGIIACNLRSPAGLAFAAKEFAGQVRGRFRAKPPQT
jgi:hypothetical protein